MSSKIEGTCTADVHFNITIEQNREELLSMSRKESDQLIIQALTNLLPPGFTVLSQDDAKVHLTKLEEAAHEDNTDTSV